VFDDPPVSKRDFLGQDEERLNLHPFVSLGHYLFENASKHVLYPAELK